MTRKMQVSLPQCMVGFKDVPVPAGESRLRRSLIGDLAVRILCGDTSPLYAKLYEKRLLGRDFDVDYSLIPDGACAILGGESRDPAAVREALERETARLAQEGIEPKLFRRMKNALYGMRLRMLDVPDLYARQEIASVLRASIIWILPGCLTPFMRRMCRKCSAAGHSRTARPCRW